MTSRYSAMDGACKFTDASSALAQASSMRLEAKNQVIEVTIASAETLEYMLDFVYSGHYTVERIVDEDLEEDSWELTDAPDIIRRTHRNNAILAHLEVIILADYYNMSDLIHYACKSLRVINNQADPSRKFLPWSTKYLIDVVRVCFEDSPAAIVHAQAIIMDQIRSELSKVTGDDLFLQEAKSISDFMVALTNLMSSVNHSQAQVLEQKVGDIKDLSDEIKRLERSRNYSQAQVKKGEDAAKEAKKEAKRKDKTHEEELESEMAENSLLKAKIERLKERLTSAHATTWALKRNSRMSKPQGTAGLVASRGSLQLRRLKHLARHPHASSIAAGPSSGNTGEDATNRSTHPPSQRDAAIRIPINYVTGPGVSVTAACFPHRRYELEAAAKCLSNLLANGFRRFVIDLYWDSNRRVWSLCPAQLPASSAINSAQATSPSSSLSGSSSTKSLETSTVSGLNVRRQTSQGSSQAPTADDGSTDGPSTTTTTLTEVSSKQPAASSTPGPITETLYTTGPYTCGPSVDISMVNRILLDFLQQTNDDLNARVRYMILNLHAASSYLQPNQPAPSPSSDDLPSGDSQIGSISLANFSSYLLAPSDLNYQRTNLNASWLSTPQYLQPVPEYYDTIDIDSEGTSSNGWPSESYMEYHNARRLLLGFGTIDPQMRGYDTSSDLSTIFPQRILEDAHGISVSASGTVSQGCIFDPTNATLAAANSSWAVSADLPSLDASSLSTYHSTPGQNAVNSLVSCGISPILNETLSNTTADVDPLPYQDFVYQSVWSWSPRQPHNDSQAPSITSTSSSTSAYRCGALNSTADGRWQVATCSTNLRGACRGHDSPYSWLLTEDRDAYTTRGGACPSNTSFAVPRTALENRYLLQAVQNLRAHNDGGADDDRLVWINFNSLNYEGCWVEGVNSTCPYVAQGRQDKDQVVVPTVAAIVVLVIAVLTILQKCGGNRSASKRKRRGDHGWDYEGVPS
ncbi:MAG: hypothetical protein M1828_000948 [Chrysothrix sp. TS-e1954]|nr:MAG: hypothetical protein M1828_000948 [Chrysothrix sp. TS-e1954]